VNQFVGALAHWEISATHPSMRHAADAGLDACAIGSPDVAALWKVK
jgi:hypothetical protein